MDTRTRSVLLAEDDFGFRFPLEALLKDSGYEVIAVSNASGVRQHHGEVDVLVLDARLPTAELAGITAAADIRRSLHQSEWKPIIFMSVMDREDCRDQLDQFPGPYEWIVKPFEIEALIDFIEKRSAEI